MFMQAEHSLMRCFTSISAIDSACASCSCARRMWYASRCADFGPIPGSRLNASMRRVIGSGVLAPSGIGLPDTEARQVQPASYRPERLLLQLAGAFGGVLDRGHDQVLQHLRVVRVHDVG